MQTQKENQLERLLYRPAEVAQVTGTSKSWVYQRIADGSIKAVRLAGRAIRVHRLEVERFIADSTENA